MDGQCLLPNTVLPQKFDGLNFDGLAGKHQKRQNFPCENFPLYGNTWFGEFELPFGISTFKIASIQVIESSENGDSNNRGCLVHAKITQSLS